MMIHRRRDGLRTSLWIASTALSFITWGCGGGERRPTTGETASAPASTVATQTGEELYQRCATCHQANGRGLPGTYPPLAGSEFVNAANAEVPIRVVLFGVQGPLTVNGTRYDGLMPPYGVGVEMSDEEVAAVLTYVRRSWGNMASAVTPDQVAKARAAHGGSGPMTEATLRKAQ